MPISIRLGTGNIRTDFEEVQMPVRNIPGYKWLRQFEEELLYFANRFKTRRLKNKNGILLDVCEFNGFNSRDLLTEFLGNAFTQYNIPLTINDKTIEAC